MSSPKAPGRLQAQQVRWGRRTCSYYLTGCPPRSQTNAPCLANEARLQRMDDIRVRMKDWRQLRYVLVDLLERIRHIAVLVVTGILAEDIIVVDIHDRFYMQLP